VELNGGLTARPAETSLTRRAAALLAAGPADSATVVAFVCNLPAPPLLLAERLAVAMFGGRPEFARDNHGRWCLVANRAATARFTSSDSELLSRLSFAVVDVETTGTQPFAGDRITEVAVALVRGGEVADCFETLVNPERPIPAFITRLTNITWDMVKDAPTFADVAPRVVATMTGHIFTAHNATFDWKFMAAELARADGQCLAGRRLCTVRLARRLLPQLPRRSLDHLARYYGVTVVGRHRAGGDALATARCLVRMLADAQDRGCETWDDLERYGRATRRRRARRAPAAPAPVANDTTA